MNNLGYTKPLYILPFDHRTSFVKKMFGIENRELTPEERSRVSEFKQTIYEAFKRVAGTSVPKENAAILADEEYSTNVLTDAKNNGYTTLVAVEKSGQDEFDFQYGEEFGAHLEKFKPTFAKALIRYNPESDLEMNTRQREKLKKLSDYTHQNGYKFLIEPLIPATEEQLAKVNGDKARYDNEIRPLLTIQMIKELQDAGVEPDVWKLEGMEDSENYKKIITQAQTNGRNEVGVVVLGRAASVEQVEKWLKAGKGIPGVIGFAVGRTIFWDPLVAYRDGKMEKETAIAQIAQNYEHFYNVFTASQ